ncbi:MAG: hypothetical protein NTV38_09765 [Chloroflexi bacterium]|nr:hypothetical protein [Chloroflexota bacterium]
MALSDRQRKGIGFLVTAALFGLAGAVLLIFTLTPTWVPVVLDVAVGVAGILGIVIVAKPEM